MDDNNFDMSDFVNFDQGFVASPPASNHIDFANSATSPAYSSQPGMMMPSQQHQYQPPSHDYGQFAQQVGLPTGATQHIDAVNAFARQTLPANFNSSRVVAYNTSFEDGDPGSYRDAQNFTGGDSMGDDFAVDPSALGPDASKTRAWPGMHSQQAKAQDAARQATRQASQQRNDEQMSMQRQLPNDFDQSLAGDAADGSEPHMNEQISRLLNQMRHNSDASSLGDGEDGGSYLDSANMARLKKDDEDMDEDERLLASEEGKKLSSKERRQLRNKVSARAFRSRRKEYITQLEGEVNAKANECDELKQTNRQLLEQNRQLTQLTKAMLAHPAFNNFMQDMSNDPSFLNSFGTQQARRHQQQQQQQPHQQQQQPTVKQEPQQAPQQPRPNDSIQVGMSMVPENNLDLSMLNLGANHWGSGSAFGQTRIYAVYDVPQGPSLDDLLPRSLNPKHEGSPSAARKETMPRIEHPVLPQVTESTASTSDPVEVEDDVEFPLYSSSPSTPTTALTHAARALELSLSDKPSQFSLQVRPQMSEAEALRSLDQLLAPLEEISERIALAVGDRRE